MSPLASSLLHTLWQAAVVWLLLAIRLRTLPSRQTTGRSRLASFALMMVVLSWFITWSWLAQKETSDVQSAPAVTEVRMQELESTVRSQTLFSQEPAAMPMRISWQQWLDRLWMTGVLISLLRVARSCMVARSLAQNSLPVRDLRWTTALNELCHTWGRPLPVHLRSSHRVMSPIVTGLWRPVIIVPASLLTGAPPDAIRAALAHELAHIIRWDLVFNLLQMVVESLLFFNPFVWLISKSIRLEREASCDALAGALMRDVGAYCSSLVWWARAGLQPQASAALPIAGDQPSWLRSRVNRLLQPTRVPGPASWREALGAAVVGALVFLTAGYTVRFAMVHLTSRERIGLIGKLGKPYQTASWEEERKRVRKDVPFSGVVVNEAGEPLPDLRWTMQLRPDITRRDGRTDAQGRFSGIIPEGRTHFWMREDGYTLFSLPMEEGVPLQDLRVVLNSGISLTLRCVDAEGQPLAGVDAVIDYGSGYGHARAKTGPDGRATLEHLPPGERGDLRLQGDRLQTRILTGVAFTPALPPVEYALNRIDPVRLTLLDEIDGHPVAGVTVSVTEMTPNPGNQPQPNAATTNADGQCLIEGVDPAVVYGMRAEAGKRTSLFVLNPARDKSLTIRLARERILRFKVINLPQHVNRLKVHGSQEIGRYGSEGRSDTEVDVEHGVASGELGGLMAESASLYFLKQWFRVPKLESAITDFTIDYAKLGIPADVKVIVTLDPGKNAVPPVGKLSASWRLPKPYDKNDYVTAEVRDGTAEFTIPKSATVHFKHMRLMGGTVDEAREYTVGSDPTPITLPVKPAGMIRVRVTDSQGRLAQKLDQITAYALKQPDKVALALGRDGSGRYGNEWAVSGPVDLGSGPYQVVAVSGLRFAASDSFKLTASQPVQDVDLLLPDPVPQRLQAVDQSGAPVAGQSLRVAGQHALSPASGYETVQTDQNGVAEIPTAGPDSVIQLQATPGNGPYVPTRYDLKPTGDAGFKVALQKGNPLRGRIVDRSTDNGVPRVEVSWQTVGNNVYGSYPVLTDADGRFEFHNAPAERLFISTSYHSPGKSIEGNRNTRGGSGEDVTLYLEDHPQK